MPCSLLEIIPPDKDSERISDKRHAPALRSVRAGDACRMCSPTFLHYTAIIPYLVSGNTNASTIMVAEKAPDLIAATHKERLAV